MARTWDSAREVVNVTKEEIKLRNGIVIAVHSNSFRTVRGRTLVVAIFDEVSFWRDENSVTPDVQVYRAVLPSLATTNGILIGISTPFPVWGCCFRSTVIVSAKTATIFWSSKVRRKP